MTLGQEFAAEAETTFNQHWGAGSAALKDDLRAAHRAGQSEFAVSCATAYVHDQLAYFFAFEQLETRSTTVEYARCIVVKLGAWVDPARNAEQRRVDGHIARDGSYQPLRRL